MAHYCALDKYILAVAIRLPENCWTAFVGAVQGRDHDTESREVLDRGTRLSEPVAIAIFPEFQGREYRE